jgi:hypothetical protein
MTDGISREEELEAAVGARCYKHDVAVVPYNHRSGTPEHLGSFLGSACPVHWFLSFGACLGADDD